MITEIDSSALPLEGGQLQFTRSQSSENTYYVREMDNYVRLTLTEAKLTVTLGVDLWTTLAGWTVFATYRGATLDSDKTPVAINLMTAGLEDLRDAIDIDMVTT